jgi:hypothetical protein
MFTTYPIFLYSTRVCWDEPGMASVAIGPLVRPLWIVGIYSRVRLGPGRPELKSCGGTGCGVSAREVVSQGI